MKRLKAALQEDRVERAERRLLRAVEAPEAPPPTDEHVPGIVDYVEVLCPGWERFDYFAPYAAELERAIGAGLTVCFAAPPQHGKTEFTLRGLLWISRYHPGYRHAYITYNQQRAFEVAEDFRRIAREAGFTVTGNRSRMMVTWAGKSSIVRFSSVKGTLTGAPVDGLMVIDDYIKGPEEARSKAHRESGVRWWNSVGSVRRHPGTSYIVMATRWPGGDLTDHLIKNEGFRYINLKAIAEPKSPEDLAEDGTVLSDPLRRRVGESLSRRKPPEYFRRDRAKPFWWVAMFQGEPRAEGKAVFAEPGSFDEHGNPIGPRYYRELPKTGYRVAYGVDLAYSTKTSADWSILLEGWESEGKLYLVNAQRKQVSATSFLLTLLAARTNRPGATFRFYSGGGGEKGVGQFIRKKLGRCFKVLPATSDKLARATPASETWNLGKILLPDPSVFDAPWVEDFVPVVTTFTGTPGEQDDDVDALAALHDQLMSRSRMLEALTHR